MDYTFSVKWNKPAASWMVDIADAGGTPIITGISLVTGADLLEQYGYLRFGGQLIAQTASNPDAVPSFTNLGSDGKLLFTSP